MFFVTRLSLLQFSNLDPHKSELELHPKFLLDLLPNLLLLLRHSLVELSFLLLPIDLLKLCLVDMVL